MMRYLTLAEVVELHDLVLQTTRGAVGVRDLGGLESALAQPKATFEGRDLHETLIEKAAALGFSLVQNHPFVDGNKRTAHAAMETFLVLNGSEIEASVDEQERLMTEVAAGRVARSQMVAWLRDHVRHVS
ncbi:MAG TPA: type II toxin-antitoxin system death-on-curing family toxin [Myxococcota bacterium]|nr:type II toxin-antitoxin system death-on-curing family toxin [Myxococcota bacterium]